MEKHTETDMEIFQRKMKNREKFKFKFYREQTAQRQLFWTLNLFI